MATVGTDIILLFEYVNDAGDRYTPSPLPTAGAILVNGDLSTDVLASDVEVSVISTGVVGITIPAANNTAPGAVNATAVTTDTNISEPLRTAYAYESVSPATFDPASQQVSVGAVNGVAVSDIDQFKADVSGLALETTVGNVKLVTDKLDAMLQPDGDGGNQFTQKALEQAPAGGGGDCDLSEIENDLDTLLQRTAGGKATFISPVDWQAGLVRIIQGQDYLVVDGGVLHSWVVDEWIPYSLLTAQSVTWYIRETYGSLLSDTVHVVANNEIDIRTFIHSVTSQLQPGRGGNLQIWAVLNADTHGGAQKRLVNAKIDVSDDIRS